MEYQDARSEWIYLFDWVVCNHLQEQSVRYSNTPAEWDWMMMEISEQVYNEASYITDVLEFYQKKEVGEL